VDGRGAAAVVVVTEHLESVPLAAGGLRRIRVVDLEAIGRSVAGERVDGAGGSTREGEQMCRL